MIVWGVPGVSNSSAFSISSITAPAGTVLFPTQWEHPHDPASLKKHLTILGDDLKPVLKILADNARSLEDYINTAYLNVTSGGTVYGPVSLESGTTFNGAAVFNSTVTAGTITATTFSGSGSSLTNIPNSATTATSANTASAIVARDASGNFTAGTVTAALTGTASGNLVSGGALGTPSSGTLTNCTFPTVPNATNAVNATNATNLTGLFKGSSVITLNSSSQGTFNHGVGSTPSTVLLTNGDLGAAAGHFAVISTSSSQVNFEGVGTAPGATVRVNFIAFA